jgi:AraC-like DNA-binding protein
MSARLLPSNIIAGMLDLAAKNQISTEALIKEAGIDPELIGEENSYLSEDQVSNIILSLYEKLDDPAFGLRLGGSIHRSIQSIAGGFFSSAESLRQAFQKLVLYQDLIIPFVELEIIESSEFIDIYLETYLGDFDELLKSKDAMGLYSIANEIIASGVWCTAEQFLSKEFGLVGVYFRHPAPGYIEEYQNIFKCPVHFEQQKNFLRIERDLFDKKLYGSLPAIHKKAEQQIEQQLKKLKKSETILNKVREFVETHISDENLSLENAAKQLHMTGRTLQRALRMENTSFIDIRDSVRSDLSMYYLQSTEISIEEISEKVGFSDASGFYTAFKRWHGVSPGSIRKSE